MKNLEGSPMPNQSIVNGTKARGGIKRKKLITLPPKCSARETLATSSPKKTPAERPTIKPTKSLRKLEERSANISGEERSSRPT